MAEPEAANVDVGELDAIAKLSHKVLDQLTAVLGYADIARDRRRQMLGVCAELEKIKAKTENAIAMVKLGMAHLRSVETLKAAVSNEQ